MVGMIGILFLACIVDVIRVSVRPNFYSFPTLIALKSNSFGHFVILNQYVTIDR